MFRKFEVHPGSNPGEFKVNDCTWEEMADIFQRIEMALSETPVYLVNYIPTLAVGTNIVNVGVATHPSFIQVILLAFLADCLRRGRSVAEDAMFVAVPQKVNVANKPGSIDSDAFIFNSRGVLIKTPEGEGG